MSIYDELKAPFPHEIISWRVGAMNKEKTMAIALAYIDARDVMERLDTVLTPAGWQALYPHANGKTSCKIGVFIPGSSVDMPCGEWVWKENGSGDSDIEAAKGAFSDSFKRAAVLWGIGRYLYDVPNIWVEVDNFKKIKNPNDVRLKNALLAAEKGIRLPDEPEAVLPITGEEFVLMQQEIKACKNIEELKETWSKINLALPRANENQLSVLIKIKEDKKLSLSQAPIA